MDEQRIPGSVDDPVMFLFWEAKVVAIAVTGMTLGILTGQPFTGLVIGLSFAYIVSRAIKGGAKGQFMRLLYWCYAPATNTRTVPDRIKTHFLPR